MFLSRPFFCLIHKQTFDKLRAIIAEGRHESKHVERIKFSRFYHKLVAHETLRKIIAFCNNNASQNHLCVKPTCGYFPLDLHHLISFVIRLNEHSLNHPQNSHFSVSTTTESESKNYRLVILATPKERRGWRKFCHMLRCLLCRANFRSWLIRILTQKDRMHANAISF